MLPAFDVAIMTRACVKYDSRARVVTLVAKQYPESAKKLRLGEFAVDVEFITLSDGVVCGPRVVKSSGNLATDEAAMQLAGQSYSESAGSQ